MQQPSDILQDLRSSELSVKFNALLRLEEVGLTKEELLEFEAILKLESDANVRFQMQKLLAAQASTRTKIAAEGVIPLIINAERDEIKLALMLEALRASEAPAVANALRNANWKNFSVQLLPSTLKFFKKYGNAEDAIDIAGLCNHDDMRVLTAAIDALEKLNSELLKKYLVPLLLNQHMGIRARAVRLMARWDLHEALRHFESLLFSESKEERHVALFQSFFFEFARIESLMLRFLSYETDITLLKKAALVFMANPDKQVPVKLMELRQTCTDLKYRLVDGILKGVLNSLYQAGLVNAEPETMLETLERHFKEKQLQHFIRHFTLGLNADDAEVRLNSALRLCEAVRAGVPGVKETLTAYCERETVVEIKNKILGLLGVAFSADIGAKTQGFQQYTEIERIDFLSKIDKEAYLRVLKPLLSDIQGFSDDELVLVISAIKKYGEPSESLMVEHFLQSDNPKLLIAAIDCLSSMNPEALHIVLPTLVNHRADEVKIEAIKVFAQFDKAQALSLLEKTLYSVKPYTRRGAIFCLGQFDFSSVSKILLNALKRESDPENLEQIQAIVRSNLDEEFFFYTYAESRKNNSAKKELFEELSLYLCEQLATTSGINKSDLLKKAETWLTDELNSQASSSAYKLEKIQKTRRQPPKQKFWDESLIRFTIIIYVIGAILTAIIWFVFMR